MPQSADVNADVVIDGDLTVDGDFTGPAFTQTTPTAVQTASYDASPGDLVICNPVSGAFTVFMPEAPVNATVVGVVMAATSPVAANTVAVQTQGSDVFDFAGTTQLIMRLSFQALVFQYDFGAAIWYLFASAYTTAALDNRYIQQITAADSSIVVGGTNADTTVGSVPGQIMQRTVCA